MWGFLNDSKQLYAYEPGLIARLLGVAIEAINAYGVKVIAYMKNRVSFPLINSLYSFSYSTVD